MGGCETDLDDQAFGLLPGDPRGDDERFNPLPSLRTRDTLLAQPH